MGILFDNVMKVFRIRSLFTGATLVSTEIDLDIPRGFIVKIHDAKLEVINIGEDFETISVDKYARYKMALVKDPDDITTIEIPSGVVDHDVIMDHEVDVLLTGGTAGDTLGHIGNTKQEQNFSGEGLDVFTARNMRMNLDVEGTDAADGTEAAGQITLNYTLEEIKDADIINILDIL